MFQCPHIAAAQHDQCDKPVVAALIRCAKSPAAEAMRERQAALQRGGQGAEATRIWQARSRASLLVDPDHLGSLWWLVLGTRGLGAPPWLAEATGDGASGPPR